MPPLPIERGHNFICVPICIRIGTYLRVCIGVWLWGWLILVGLDGLDNPNDEAGTQESGDETPEESGAVFAKGEAENSSAD